MKKVNITPKAKRVILISAMAVICIGVVALVANVNLTAAADTANPSSIDLITDDGSSDLSISPIEDNSSAASEAPVFVPSSGASQSAQLTVISKPTSTPPKPVVQGDASTASNGTKTQPTNSALTNKNNKPSYTSKPTVPSRSATSNPSSNNQGQTDPVFGNKQGTGGQGTVVSGMHEGGSQVGIMD